MKIMFKPFPVTAALTAGAALVLMSACSTTPVVERQGATLGEVNTAGLECRREPVTGSLRSQTICATPEQWAAYDEEQREEYEDFERIRNTGVDDPFRPNR
ncbi:MAG: hypothetical protein PVI23_12755 [Maricaulaceae bacterium]|jgi:hypothetical protein